MANIKKRPNGSYQATVYVGRDKDGKIIREYITRPTLKECKQASREREIEIESSNSGAINNRKMLVVDWIDQWITLNNDRLSPSTIRLYRLYLKAHYAPFFIKMTLSNIAGNEILIRQFMAEKLKTLSANTVCKLMTVLDKILREGLRDKNPVQFIELPKKQKYQPHVITNQEFDRIFEALKGTSDEPFLLLAAWCGLRLGEICALEPSDILISTSRVCVDENMVINNDYEWVIKDPKSANGKRSVATPEYLMQLLTSIIKEKGKISGRIFSDYTPSSYSHRWAKLIKDKNLPVIRFHDLRHYHASWLYEQGLPDQYAAKRLGHDINTLKCIYQHLGLSQEADLDMQTVSNLCRTTCRTKTDLSQKQRIFRQKQNA